MADLVGRRKKEIELTRQLARWGSRQRRAILGYLTDRPAIEQVPDDYWETHDSELFAALMGPLANTFIEQGSRLALFFGLGYDWALANQFAEIWAQGYGFDLVKGINQTSRNALRRSIGSYYRLGQNRQTLESSISRIFGPERASSIAVTEISRATVWGEFAFVNDLNKTGVKLIPHWATNVDELVCPICRPLNNRPADGYKPNTIFGGEEPYWLHPAGLGVYGLDPAHVNCRCWRNWIYKK